jgi:cell division transport system permease protein
MFGYRLYYFVREALKNIRHSFFLTTVSVSTIAVSLILVGFFTFLLLNANRFLDQVAQDLRVSVYLHDGVAPARIDAILAEIRAREEVAGAEFVTKAEDRERSLELLPGELLEGLDDESVPAQASIEITLKKRRLLKGDIETVNTWLSSLEAVDAVDDTLFGADKLRVVHATIDLIQVSGSVISVIVILAAVFFTFSTIKLAVYARKDEIEILRLVGATNRFIRIPFYIEGLVQGVVGSLLAVGIVLIIKGQINVFVQEVHFLNLRFELFESGMLLWFLAGGVVLGVLGSVLSVGRYLRG